MVLINKIVFFKIFFFSKIKLFIKLYRDYYVSLWGLPILTYDSSMKRNYSNIDNPSMTRVYFSPEDYQSSQIILPWTKMSLNFQVYAKKMILHPNYETYEFNLWYVYLFNMSVWYSIQIRPQLQLNVKNRSNRAKN